MASFNKVILIGNLVRDPQVRQLQNQTSVVDFGIAVNEKWTDKQGNKKEKVGFFDVKAFGKVAEIIGQHFTKGKPIFIEGKLVQDTWEDKNGGGKRSKVSVMLENFQFVGHAGGGAVDRSSDQTNTPRQQSQQDDAAPGEFDPEDVPF